MTTEAGKKCIVCGQNTSSLTDINSGYCYRHYQIFDSLKNEFAARQDSTTNSELSWKDFLLRKKQENLDPDLQKVIQTELSRK
jgi:hypothetical protein